MSFSQTVKNELASINNNNDRECCLRASAYGLLLFGRNFSPSQISLLTESEATAHEYIEQCLSYTGIEPKLSTTKSGKFRVGFENKNDISLVYQSFDHNIGDINLRIYRSNLENDCCYPAFLRSVFLSCGTIADPKKNYHLEFVVPYVQLSRDLFKVIDDLNLNPKMTKRGRNNIIYFKDSENIEDALATMGANNSTLELMGIKMMKDFRNKVNRKVNFETANISRTVNASVVQIEAINKIIEKVGINSLPESLREIAQIRLDNPDMSLDEIRNELSEELSRSGVNHRLNRIIKIADEIPV